jgi:hypothetical protein
VVTVIAARSATGAGSALRWAPTVVLVACVLAATCVVLTTVNDPGGVVSRQYDAFTKLQNTANEKTRFLSGGGNRYDYWRVAVDEFRDEPVRGVGAGSYQFGYFKERRTPEDIRQPHSLELQALAELGVVGGALVLVFILAVLFGLARRASFARRSPAEAGMVVAAGGIFLVWLVHTSVDWIHLIPGVTGAALAAAAVLLSPWKRTAPVAAGSRNIAHRVVVVACAVLVVAAAISLGRATLADRHAGDAQAAATSDPARAIAETDKALALNRNSISTYYTRAAAYARLNDYARARGALLDALKVEPENFVTWALLGDLAVRHGDKAQAETYYRRALALNPRDTQLRTQVPGATP